MRGTAWASSARSEEHTSELQSPIDISYAVFCLKKKKKTPHAARWLLGAFLTLHLPFLPASREDHESINFALVVRHFDVALFFFFNDTATTEIYTSIDTLSLHDALPICWRRSSGPESTPAGPGPDD